MHGSSVGSKNMARARNLEHEAISQRTDLLVTAVQNCIGQFTSKCFSKGLISEDVEDFTNTNHTDMDKARRLVKNVRDGIKNDRSRFDTFVEVLREFSHLESEVETLLGNILVKVPTCVDNFHLYIGTLSDMRQLPSRISSSSPDPENDSVVHRPVSSSSETQFPQAIDLFL